MSGRGEDEDEGISSRGFGEDAAFEEMVCRGFWLVRFLDLDIWLGILGRWEVWRWRQSNLQRVDEMAGSPRDLERALRSFVDGAGLSIFQLECVS